MAIKRNVNGYSHAHAMVMGGKVDHTSDADDGMEQLGRGGDNWGEYAKWFLGVDDAAEPNTLGRFQYPFGKAGAVCRQAVIAIKGQAVQRGEDDIAAAADKLLGKIDKDMEPMASAVARCDAGMVPWELPDGDENVPPMEFRVFSLGENVATWDDGTTATYILDAESMGDILAAFIKRGKDLEIDYDHGSSSPVNNGPRPAAGWAGLAARDDGMYVVMKRWTDTAASMLRNREYRYFSPEFVHDKKAPFKIREITAVALTNRPAMMMPMPLAASATASPNPTTEVVTDTATPPMGEGEDMSKVLSLLSAASDDEAVQAVETMRAALSERGTALVAATAAVATMGAELASAKASRDATDALITEIATVAGCAPDAIVGVVKASIDTAAEVASARAEIAKVHAARDEAERTELIAKAALAHDKAEWLRAQSLATVRSYVATCCATPEIATTPQSVDAAPRSEDAPEGWFLTLDHIEQLPKAEQSNEWRKYLAYKANARPAVTAPASVPAAQ